MLTAAGVLRLLVAGLALLLHTLDAMVAGVEVVGLGAIVVAEVLGAA